MKGYREIFKNYTKVSKIKKIYKIKVTENRSIDRRIDITRHDMREFNFNIYLYIIKTVVLQFFVLLTTL